MENPIHRKRSQDIAKCIKGLLYPLAFFLVAGFFDEPVSKHEAVTPIQPTERASKNIFNDSSAESAPAVDTSPSKKLMITCQERTWVSVVIDDIEKKEFMLNPQDIIILNAKATYDLLIGNAGGVKLILDGNDVQFSGMSGEVKRIKLS